MVGGLAQWQSQMAVRYGWGIFFPNGFNQQTKQQIVANRETRGLDWEAVAWCQSFGLVRHFQSKNLRTLLLWNNGKSAQLHEYVQFFSGQSTTELETPNNTFFKMGLRHIRLIWHKTTWKANLMKNLSTRNNGLHDHLTSIYVIIFYGVILSIKYTSHYHILWMS